MIGLPRAEGAHRLCHEHHADALQMSDGRMFRRTPKCCGSRSCHIGYAGHIAENVRIEDDPQALVHPVSLQAVLSNLVVNCFQHVGMRSLTGSVPKVMS